MTYNKKLCTNCLGLAVSAYRPALLSYTWEKGGLKGVENIWDDTRPELMSCKTDFEFFGHFESPPPWVRRSTYKTRMPKIIYDVLSNFCLLRITTQKMGEIICVWSL